MHASQALVYHELDGEEENASCGTAGHEQEIGVKCVFVPRSTYILGVHTHKPCFFELFSLKSLGHSPAPEFVFWGYFVIKKSCVWVVTHRIYIFKRIPDGATRVLP